MENNLMEVNNETAGIANSVNNLDGVMSFFSQLIEDCQTHPELAAFQVKNGEMTNQLSALFKMIGIELHEIEEYNKSIYDLSETTEEIQEKSSTKKIDPR